jgi:Zn-dependent M28 family amino/carboxypeptidase
VIFLVSTGEEKGLLGADFFARHPAVPIEKVVGNVDLDMPVLLYPSPTWSPLARIIPALARSSPMRVRR